MTKTKGKLISDGGEGYIYEVQDEPYQLMKIFKDTDLSGAPIVTDDLNAKLGYMVKNPPEVLISKGAVAWPLERISKNGKLSGFIMPKLNVDEHIQRTYSYRHPKLEASDYARFPSVKSRIKIAINLCSAIDELHRKGYVFGDFNHHNVGVNYSTGQVCFMDCDSFHITDDSGKVHRTNVIMPGYLAPEIIAHCNKERAAGHDYDLDKVALPTFTKESDLFCLAIHIFKLLMNGVDPFRGVEYDSVGSTASPFMGNEAIERDAYVFKQGKKAAAVFCPPAESLPPDILELFKKAFIDGREDPSQRPSAADWYITLNRLLTDDLKQCESNIKHQYYRCLDSCPYCTADDRHLTEQGGAPDETLQKSSPVDGVEFEKMDSWGAVGSGGRLFNPQPLKQRIPGRGFAITSLIMAVIGISGIINLIMMRRDGHLTEFAQLAIIIPFSVYSVLSVVFAVASVRRGYSRIIYNMKGTKMNIAGIGYLLGVLGLCSYVVFFILMTRGFV